MNLQTLTESIKDYGRDIRLNLSSVLTEEGAPGLTAAQIHSVALACAYHTGHKELIGALLEQASPHISPEHIEASKAAATIMAMNNVYYRFLYMADDPEFKKLPARLRMNVIGKPGIEKVDFELMCLAVSAIEGCGSCVKAHVHEVKSIGHQGIQSAIRIASVVNAAARALAIG